jgi:hypothetical protein
MSDQHREFTNVHLQPYESHMALNEEIGPISNVSGPNLDFTDFESWLSDFESSTIPDSNTIIPSAIPTANGLGEDISEANVPSMANTDWDAVSDKWSVAV